jgi:hypothetical protein
MRLHLVLLCLGLMIPAHALGDEDEPTAYGEPVNVDELLPNEPGEWELQASLEARQQPRGSDAESPAYLVAVPRAQLLVGLVEGLGAELDVPLLLRKQGEVTVLGLGDVELSALLQLLEQGTQAVDLVASLELLLPTGSERRGLGGGQLEIGASLGMAITRSAVTWQGTVGYSLAPGELEQELEADLSVALALPPALHAYVELSGEADLPDFEPRLALGPAMRWSITPRFAMSAGALFGVTQAATPLRFIIEAQQEF